MVRILNFGGNRRHVTGVCIPCINNGRDVMRLGPCKEGCEHYKAKRKRVAGDTAQPAQIKPRKVKINYGGMAKRAKYRKVSLPPIKPKGE